MITPEDAQQRKAELELDRFNKIYNTICNEIDYQLVEKQSCTIEMNFRSRLYGHKYARFPLPEEVISRIILSYSDAGWEVKRFTTKKEKLKWNFKKVIVESLPFISITAKKKTLPYRDNGK